MPAAGSPDRGPVVTASILPHVVIHTDGACIGNPGPGGWAALLRHDNAEREISGGCRRTTNNRMELQAAVSALRALKVPCRVTLFTDSRYVKDGIESWIVRWKANGWVTRRGRGVANADLWRDLDDACTGHTVTWRWVKGHAGNRDNERADRLAAAAADWARHAG